MTLSGYPPEDLLLRPELYRRVDRALAHIGRLVSGIDLVLGYPVLRDGSRFNAAGVMRDGEIVAEYHKRELPNYQVFDEKRYFSAGDAPCLVEIQGIPVALSICEDIWVDEPAFREKNLVWGRVVADIPDYCRELIAARQTKEAVAILINENLPGGGFHVSGCGFY